MPDGCAKAVEDNPKAVDRRGKPTGTKVPKLKVSKQGFDRVLVKLIQTKPVKRAHTKPAARTKSPK